VGESEIGRDPRLNANIYIQFLFKGFVSARANLEEKKLELRLEELFFCGK